MAALAKTMRQELPDVADGRAEFTVDGVPYVFTADGDGAAVFVYAVLGALPDDAAAKARMFEELLHAQFCFAESGGFSFGADPEDTFVLLQALVDTERYHELAFVALVDKFVKTANVWARRLANLQAEPPAPADGDETAPAAPGLFV